MRFAYEFVEDSDVIKRTKPLSWFFKLHQRLLQIHMQNECLPKRLPQDHMENVRLPERLLLKRTLIVHMPRR